MNVLIVESPSKAKSINKYLGNQYKVLASIGHVRDLTAKNDAIDTENDFKMMAKLFHTLRYVVVAVLYGILHAPMYEHVRDITLCSKV